MIDQIEVMQELWCAVLYSNPSYFTTGSLMQPVEKVTYSDCVIFLAQLNYLTGMNFRFPTEAEWEYAARGGNKSSGYKYAGSNNVDDLEPAAIDGIKEDSCKVIVRDGHIVVEGAGNTPIEVIDMAGCIVFNGFANPLHALPQGIYIIRINGQSYKVKL